MVPRTFREKKVILEFVDKHKTGYFHIGKDSKFIFLTSFFSKLIEKEVQEMESNWREKKRNSKDLEFVGDLNSKHGVSRGEN